MDKAPDAFRTISEVADDLKVPQHVLRFWESRFAQIKPMKRAGGRRYYRPDDVDLLRGIHHLLYGEGYTIRGVQRILRDQGIKSVQTVWQAGAVQPARMPEDEEDDVETIETAEEALPSGLFARLRGRAPEAPPREPPRSEPPLAAASGEERQEFSREELRKLQVTLFELQECRRLLDEAMDEAG